MPNFVKMGQMVAEIWCFSGFSRLQKSSMMDYQIPKNLVFNWMQRSQVHHRAKLCHNW